MKKATKRSISLLLTTCCLLLYNTTAYAEIGDNIGGGSGGGAGGAIDPRYSYATSLPQDYRVSLITNSGEQVKISTIKYSFLLTYAQKYAIM